MSITFGDVICLGGLNPICWPFMMSGCDSDNGSSVAPPDADAVGNPGQGVYNPNACKLPEKSPTGVQTYFKDVFITDNPTKEDECATVQAALTIANKEGATIKFKAGDHHKESFTVPSTFKELSFKTDLKTPTDLPAILTPAQQSGQTIMTLEESKTEVTVSQIEISDLIFDGLQNNNAIHMVGGHKPEHIDDFNLSLFNVKIQDAKQGLIVDGNARILADNLDIAHPDQAVVLGAGTESEFFGLNIHDMAGYAAESVFTATGADSVKIEGALFSNLGSSQSVLKIQTKLAWIYGAAFINNQVAGSIVSLDLEKLHRPEINKEHQVGNLLMANNTVGSPLLTYQTDDRATFHNLGIHHNNGQIPNIIASAGNTGPSTLINSSITDNQVASGEVITGTEVSGPNAVGVHGVNVFNNRLLSGENIYGADNYSIPHCGKSENGIVYDITKQILFPDAFDLNTTDHEQCALAQGGVLYASWTNNVDGTLGHVGVTGGWKAQLMTGVYQFITDLYKDTIRQ